MEFNRIIKLLRKERGITQKQAAEDLGVSQALLSHYEKGIRECGLDFVVRVADYYNVSCDYLLGRSAERNGMMLNADDLPNPDPHGRGRDLRKGSAGPWNSEYRGHPALLLWIFGQGSGALLL